MKTLTRFSDWEQRLNDFLALNAGTEHQDGVMDCIIYSFGAVKALTGEDCSKPYRGKYKNPAEGLKLLGVKTIPQIVSKFLPEIKRADVRRGDLVLTSDGNVGVAFGENALCIGEKEGGEPGLIRVHRSEWRKGWAVG